MFARIASCDVTPRDRPIRLAGYGSRTNAVSVVLDPIEISAVLLECTSQRCLIVSFDLLIVGSELQDNILSRLRRLGFRPEQIVLLASHTHYAPATDQACLLLGSPDTEFVDEVATAVENLLKRIQRAPLSLVRLEVFRGNLDHSINRRRYWPFPTFGRTYGLRLKGVNMAPNRAGPRDERATVVLLRNADNGAALGAIWHYACHPTAVVPDNLISADYPGAVRRSLRRRFGEIPCVFMQGFCGDTRPNITPTQKAGLGQRLRKFFRTIASGPLFSSPSADDWGRWSDSLAAGVDTIAQGNPAKTFAPTTLRIGSASISLDDFFTGSTPDKRLTAQIVEIGKDLEIIALSAEASVQWQDILDGAAPLPSGRIRIYAGYLGALFGYLPTAAQIPEGGYEVEGFQSLFGLSGRFDADRIGPAITGCVGSAFEDMARDKSGATVIATSSAP